MLTRVTVYASARMRVMQFSERFDRELHYSVVIVVITWVREGLNNLVVTLH